jgi:hypothetical protein
MRTITYTYDESRPTNRDYLIAALAEEIDDGGASFESAVRYHVDCPYCSTADCLNEHENNQYGTADYHQGCVRCKISWLLRGYDTYPSDDGRWEIDEE